MDLKQSHTVRREVRQQLEDQQRQEADAIKQINDAMLETQKKVIAAVADWLWLPAPPGRVEIGQRLNVDWSIWKTNRTLADAGAAVPRTGVKEHLGHLVGRSEQARAEKALEDFLIELVGNLTSQVDQIQHTALGQELKQLLDEGQNEVKSLWAEYASTAVQTLDELIRQLTNMRYRYTDGGPRTGPSARHEDDDE